MMIQQNYVCCINYNTDEFTHTQQFCKENKILNNFLANILNYINVTHHRNRKIGPGSFLAKFAKPAHHPTLLNPV